MSLDQIDQIDSLDGRSGTGGGSSVPTSRALLVATDASGLLTIGNFLGATVFTVTASDGLGSQVFPVGTGSSAGSGDGNSPPVYFAWDFSGVSPGLYMADGEAIVSGEQHAVLLEILVTLLPATDLTLGLPSGSPDYPTYWTGGTVYLLIIEALSGMDGSDVTTRLIGQPVLFTFSDTDYPRPTVFTPVGGQFSLLRPNGPAPLFATCTPSSGSVPSGVACVSVWLSQDGGGTWQGAGYLDVAAGAG